MVRGRYYTDPARKQIEIYRNFSGGLNTTTANSNLADSELTDLVNIDLGERGSLKRRNGMVKHITLPGDSTGKGQGYFRYYRQDGTFEEFVAVDGRIYDGSDGLIKIIIGLSAGFQKEKQIQAVQYGTVLYVATGTKLLQYEGVHFSVVEPYKPKPLEALYVGLNGLADDPNNYMDSGESSVLEIEGVTFEKRYGVINEPHENTVFVSKPLGMEVEYKREYRILENNSDWKVGDDWQTSNVFYPKATAARSYSFRYSVREVGTTEEKQYIVPKYTYYENEQNEEVPSSTIHTCNRILLHWDRLILYGDDEQKNAIFISHLKNPRYFPTVNSLEFTNKEREGITSIVRYRDMLVVFTPSSIQALYGTNPNDFRRIVLNTSIGCIAPETARVMENYIAFLSNDGVYILKSVGYNETRANVEKIDNKVDNLVERHENACAIVADSQYHIVFPDEEKRLRYYYNQNGVWTQDDSPHLNFNAMYYFDGYLYGQSIRDGHVRKFDYDVWEDFGWVYPSVIETKSFDMGMPYNQKKLKELQVMFANEEQDTNIAVTVLADSAIVLNPDNSHAYIQNGEVHWSVETTPNLNIDAGTVFGDWEMGGSAWGSPTSTLEKLSISGKCLQTKVRFVHEESKPSQLLGLAFVYKAKKP